MKSKARVVVACTLFFVVAVLVVSVRQLMFGQTPAVIPVTANVNTVSLNLTSAQLDPLEGNSVIRAFVPTGSKSVNCLATMNEIGTSDPVTGITVFCGEREPFGFGGVPGMLVSVFFPQPPPSDLVLSLTLYQQGAAKYGPPVLCNANSGC
jgi:hypothetical protein